MVSACLARTPRLAVWACFEAPAELPERRHVVARTINENRAYANSSLQAQNQHLVTKPERAFRQSGWAGGQPWPGKDGEALILRPLQSAHSLAPTDQDARPAKRDAGCGNRRADDEAYGQ